MSRRFAIYLWSLTAAAVALLGLLIWRAGGIEQLALRSTSPFLIAMLGLIGLVAYQFPVLMGENRKAHVASSPLLAGAFLFDPVIAFSLAFVTALAGNVLLRLPYLPRRPQYRKWWNCLFNGVQTALSIGLAALVYRAISPEAPRFQPETPHALLGVMAAIIVAYLANTAFVAGFVCLLRNVPNPFGLWWAGRKKDWREELGLGLLAVMTGLLANDYPWAILLQAGSIAIVHLSFQHSAHLQRQTRETVERMAGFVDRRDPYTYMHSRNVCEYAVRIAGLMKLAAPEVELLRTAALVHDIGKITVRDNVLLKPGRLTEAEYAEMRRHAEMGADMVKNLPDYQDGLRLIRHHHEAWDGSGYPSALRGNEIPLGARIMAVADSFDAMNTDRPYRQKLPLEVIIENLERGAGKQWDPTIIELWVREVRATMLPAPAPAPFAPPARQLQPQAG